MALIKWAFRPTNILPNSYISRVELTFLRVELHGEGSGKAVTTTTDTATGEVIERPEGYEPPVLETV